MINAAQTPVLFKAASTHGVNRAGEAGLAGISPAQEVPLSKGLVAPGLKEQTGGVFNRLKGMTTQLFDDGVVSGLKNVLKGIYKGTIAGGVVGGLASLNPGGLFLGAFLGGLGEGCMRTLGSYNHQVKLDLLEVAGRDVHQAANTQVNRKNTTLNFTSGKKVVDLSRLKENILNKEQEVATLLLNEKNNLTDKGGSSRVQRLNLSHNAAIDEEFIANLMAAATPQNANRHHGLDQMKIDLRDTGVLRSGQLKAALEANSGFGKNIASFTMHSINQKGQMKIDLQLNGREDMTSIVLKLPKNFQA